MRRRKQVNFRLSEEEFKFYQEMSKCIGIPFSKLVRTAMDYFLKHEHSDEYTKVKGKPSKPEGVKIKENKPVKKGLDVF